MEALKKRDRFIAHVAEDNGENVGYCIATVDGLVGAGATWIPTGVHLGYNLGASEGGLFSCKWNTQQ
jgi:hypothetical protein